MKKAGHATGSSGPPLVSVIVAAYNAEATLAETLRSALAQDYRNIEIIVVDDGSEDSTFDIAAGFAAADPRLRVLRQENKGVSSARNLALRKASGEYIAPLDADDLWHATKIGKQVAVATAAPEPVGFVYTFERRIDMDGMVRLTRPGQRLRGIAVHRHLLTVVGCGSSSLIRREAALEAGGYDERLKGNEDYLLQLKIASRYPIDFVPEHLVGYRIRPGSASSDVEAMRDTFRKMRRIFREDCPGVDHDVDVWMRGRRTFGAADGGPYRRRRGAVAVALARALLLRPVWTLRSLYYRATVRFRREGPAVSDPGAGMAFLAADPAEGPAPDPIRDALMRRQDKWLGYAEGHDKAYAARLRSGGRGAQPKPRADRNEK